LNAAELDPLVTANIEQLEPYRAGKQIADIQREHGLTHVAKLAANENPLGPSPKAIEAAKTALGDLHRYPDQGATLLRERLGQLHGCHPDEIVQGNGSNELIELLVRTFCTDQHHIVFAEPAFVVYRMIALAHGVPFTAVPLRDFQHDLEAMAAAVTPRTRVLFITNPNNPTATYVTRAAVEQLFRAVPPEVIIAFDEAYIDYADAEDFADSLALRGLRERVVSIRTFSKIHGLASLRVGYGVGPRTLMEYLNRVRAPFNVGIVPQAAAVAALDDVEHVSKSRELNCHERRRVTRALEELGFDVVPSQANFVFVDVKRPALALNERLLKRGVIVRPFGNGTFLRITIGTEAENTQLLEALAESCKD
jgi:histidinol-phosphate aminotransferase